MSQIDLQAANERFLELLQSAGPPEWLVRMQREYAATGKVRPEDLRRLLGDPNRRVESSPQAALTAFSAVG